MATFASGDLGNPWLDQLPGVFAGAFLRTEPGRIKQLLSQGFKDSVICLASTLLPTGRKLSSILSLLLVVRLGNGQSGSRLVEKKRLS